MLRHREGMVALWPEEIARKHKNRDSRGKHLCESDKGCDTALHRLPTNKGGGHEGSGVAGSLTHLD